VNPLPLFDPSGLIVEPSTACEREQLSIAFVDIESDAVMKLPEIDGTHMQWPAITLIQVIGAVHQAIKENAVLNSEHMTCLMRQDFTASAQHDSSVIGSLDSVKLRIVPGKTEYANAFAQRCLTKQKFHDGSG
jgi:hypothetical protein